MKKLFTSLLLTYFRLLSSLQLAKNKQAIIIGVTGSAGKSSLCSALSLLLASHGRVKQSGFANSQSGIPLSILGLHPHNYTVIDWLRLTVLAPFKLLTNWEHFDYYVVEMGIDGPYEPSNMSYLLKIVDPHVGVVLNAGLAHAQAFDHLVKDRDPLRRATKLTTLIAQEKMKLARSIAPSGLAVINIDQKELAKEKKNIVSRVITIGTSKQAALRVMGTKLSRHGYTVKLSYQGRMYTLSLPNIFPPHYSYTFAGAIAVATGLGITIEKSCKLLAEYHAPPGRLNIFAGTGGSTLIDSSYNASPATMREALELLSKIAGKAKKIAVLGDMRELGTASKQAHRNLSDWALKNCDEVLLFGEATRTYTLPRLQASKFSARHYTHMSDLIKALKKIAPKSIILIKGSQNELYLERAVEALLADKGDIAKLCRRGPYWDRLRSQAT